MFRFSLKLLFQTFLILRQIKRDMIANLNWSLVTVILVSFQQKLNYDI